MDETQLADRRGVTPIGKDVKGGEREGGWKEQMRAAERIERRRLEEKRARNDRYTWSLTSLHPSSYLRTHIPRNEGEGMTEPKADWISGSILLKLAYELRERGFLTSGPQDEAGDWRSQLGQVWTVTMPSIAGITGINPLTVHYCYRPHPDKSEKDKRGAFWLCVLEVHNTFSERHIYVLEANKDEDTDEKRAGYEHQWTFARSFHVSPFNDRGGFYRLFLKEPFAQSSDTFQLGIRLLLLVEAEEEEKKLVKKLMATLDSISPTPSSSKAGGKGTGRCVRPLSSATLYAALMRQPVDLFLTFFRILWEAGKLHFRKGLDAFGRPDMVQPSESTSESEYDGVGLPPALNRIQAHRGAQDSGRKDASVGLVYPEPGWNEKVAKEYVQSMLGKRAKELEKGTGERWTVEVRSTDPADPGLNVTSSVKAGEGKERKLVLYTRSYGVYVDLMTYQPARLALLLGSIVGRRWGVSSTTDFNAFFPNTAVKTSGLRKRQFDFLLSSAQHDRQRALELLNSFGIPTASTSKESEEEAEGWKVKAALFMGYVAGVAEKKLFGWLGARYVKGTEPWLELERGLEYVERMSEEEQGGTAEGDKAGWDTRLGSVYGA